MKRLSSKRGKDNGVVIMSLKEYNPLLATNHEWSPTIHGKRLDSAIDKLKTEPRFKKN